MVARRGARAGGGSAGLELRALRRQRELLGGGLRLHRLLGRLLLGRLLLGLRSAGVGLRVAVAALLRGLGLLRVAVPGGLLLRVGLLLRIAVPRALGGLGVAVAARLLRIAVAARLLRRGRRRA
ncbi:hypothetical protein ACWC5I_10435 [Kitasatospora sp. NPDC001574]